MSKITNDYLRPNPVWHRMICSCTTHMTTVYVKGLIIKILRWLTLQKVLVELFMMLRRQWIPDDQQQQQPLDLIAGVVSPPPRHQQDLSSSVRDSGRLQSHSCSCRQRCHSLSCRRWQIIVCVLFAASLLFNATVTSVVWWNWQSTNCSTSQPTCPVDHVSPYTHPPITIRIYFNFNLYNVFRKKHPLTFSFIYP